jgi:hypothetical protein
MRVKQSESALIKAEFDRITYLAEPERSLKVKAGELAVAAVEAQAPDKVLSVTANGSAFSVDGNQIENSIRLDVHPVTE